MKIEQEKIVWLRSGGPPMTVKFEIDDKEWVCSWFVQCEIREHVFTEKQLTDKDPNPGSIGIS